MAQGLSNIMKKLTTGKQVEGTVHNAKARQFRAVLDLANADVKGASGDTNLITRLPVGVVVDHIRVVSSVSLTTSTLAFGTAASASKYGAAAAYGTTPNAAQDYFAATVMDDEPLTATEDVVMTIGTANLPSSGIVIVDVFVTARN